MPSWPTNWKNQTLASADIPVTPFTLAVMSSWMKSTPLDPWTNNPLGMPSQYGPGLKVHGTRYAAFPNATAFYAAFGRFAATVQGKALVHALTDDGNYAGVWRAVSALRWPGADTETDYPSALLDLTTETYRKSVGASQPSDRKTSGVIRAPAAVHEAMLGQARSLHHAASTFDDATKAVQYLLRRHGHNG